MTNQCFDHAVNKLKYHIIIVVKQIKNKPSLDTIEECKVALFLTIHINFGCYPFIIHNDDKQIHHHHPDCIFYCTLFLYLFIGG